MLLDLVQPVLQLLDQQITSNHERFKMAIYDFFIQFFKLKENKIYEDIQFMKEVLTPYLKKYFLLNL